MTQCSLNIELQPLTFTTDRAKVAYVITLLTGRAREWGTAAWEAGSPFCYNYQTFTDEMRRVFDRSMHGREAARQLLQSRQGRRSVSDYAIDFCTLATNCGWGVEAQFDTFYNGLAENIKDEIATRELPKTFNELVELAIRVDKRVTQRRQERNIPSASGFSAGSAPPCLMSPESSSAQGVEPMQIDRTRLTSVERQRRISAKACLYCGTVGHFIATCPVKDNARQ